MANSKTIAGLIGPTLIASACSMLLNWRIWPDLVDRAFHDAAVVFVSGILTFVAGLAIVQAHNRWTGGWPVIVTVLGWLCVFGGLLRMLALSRLGDFASRAMHHDGVVLGAAAVVFVLGGFLTFKAYSRN